MKFLSIFILAITLVTGCNPGSPDMFSDPLMIDTIQGVSLLGTNLISKQIDPEADSARVSSFLMAEKLYIGNPDNTDALIWMGRRMAYLGGYKEAIEIFTDGIRKFPDDARMYRHRGHRYISVRDIDRAIADLERAAELIVGTKDSVEPDGIPNVRNNPVSTTHRNIWYHLGLAYYLNNNMGKALYGFNRCREISDNADMLVASTNWIYMILRRMGKDELAVELLEPINSEMDVYENMSYHNLLLFYKGELTEKELMGDTGEMSSANNAVVYGLGNWYYYNGDSEKAKKVFENLVKRGIWAAFGTIAAEADLSRMDE